MKPSATQCVQKKTTQILSQTVTKHCYLFTSVIQDTSRDAA